MNDILGPADKDRYAFLSLSLAFCPSLLRCSRYLILIQYDGSYRYLILDVLGQGTFGQVVKCQNMKTHEIVAVKVVKNKPAYFQQSMMEVTILEIVSHFLR